MALRFKGFELYNITNFTNFCTTPRRQVRVLHGNINVCILHPGLCVVAFNNIAVKYSGHGQQSWVIACPLYSIDYVLPQQYISWRRFRLSEFLLEINHLKSDKLNLDKLQNILHYVNYSTQHKYVYYITLRWY